jgi:hypothetical protein
MPATTDSQSESAERSTAATALTLKAGFVLGNTAPFAATLRISLGLVVTAPPVRRAAWALGQRDGASVSIPVSAATWRS